MKYQPFRTSQRISVPICPCRAGISIFLCLLAVLLPRSSSAVEIRLKNGAVLAGDIVAESEKAFSLETGKSQVTIYKEQILEIDGSKYRPESDFRYEGLLEEANTSALADEFARMGKRSYQQKDFLQAAEHFERAARVESTLPSPRGRAIASHLTWAAGSYEAVKKYPKALELYQQVLSLDKESGSRKNVAESYMCLGTVYWKTGKLEQALQYYSTAKKIIEGLGNEDLTVSVYTNIGKVFEGWGLGSRAIEYYESALQVATIYKKNKEAADLHRRIGRIEESKFAYAKALVHYGQAKEIAQRLLMLDMVAEDLRSIGIQCFNLAEYDRSATSLAESQRWSLQRYRQAGPLVQPTYKAQIQETTQWLIAALIQDAKPEKALEAALAGHITDSGLVPAPPSPIQTLMRSCGKRAAMVIYANTESASKAVFVVRADSIFACEVSDTPWISTILRNHGKDLREFSLAHTTPAKTIDSSVSQMVTERASSPSALQNIVAYHESIKSTKPQVQGELANSLSAILIAPVMRHLGDLDSVTFVPDKGIHSLSFRELAASSGLLSKSVAVTQLNGLEELFSALPEQQHGSK